MRQDPIDPELLDHLAVEFGGHGERAVGFLQTAHALLSGDSTESLPRLPEAITYCLREAMKTIPASQPVGGGGLWRSASRAVTDARRRYELVRGLPGEDAEGALDDLLAAIGDLDLVHSQEGIHERRLIAVMVNRTGALPVASGTAPIQEYQDLLGELDEALHGDSSMDRARELWGGCAAILRQLFLPPEVRHLELESLAAVESPSADDVHRLLPLIAGPNHLRHFLSRIATPQWLYALIDTGILDPPADGEPWPVFAAVDRVAPDHGPLVGSWLDAMYDRHPTDAGRAWFVARAAADVGPDAAAVLLRALVDHGSVSGIATIGPFAIEEFEPESPLVEQLADVLLNDAPWHAAYHVDPVVERLVDGTAKSNASRRIQLLSWKLRSAASSEEGHARWFSFERAGSVADWADDHRDDRFSSLLEALVDVIRRAREWVSTDEILAIIDSLPIEVRGRLRAWVLSTSPDTTLDVLIEELSVAISHRDPTGDDLPIVDRVVAEAATREYTEPWLAALGPAPTVVEVAQRLPSHELTEEWLRAYHWTGLLPEEAIGSWAQPAAVIAGAFGRPVRATLEKRSRVVGGTGRSPISLEELAALPVSEAVRRVAEWRPDGSEWLVSARELARTLEALVKADSTAWIASPVQIATELRQPTYIHHYLRSVAQAIEDGARPPIAEILDVIGLVRAHPWVIEPLGRDDFDYDHDWSGAEQAAVDVLKGMADKDLGFGGRDDEVWQVLAAEARNRGAPSAIVSEARDPLDYAINRRCTRALEVVLSFMAHEFRITGTARQAAFDLLEEALRLEGSDGAEHRAIIATRLGFLRHIAPQWVDDAADLMFGDDAPPDLAQVTADVAIKWGRPNRWLFERYRPLLLDAVSRNVDNALDHLMIAMLWTVTGYSVEENIAFLRQTPALLSDAGEGLGRLLRHDDAEEALVATAVSFWDAANSTADPDALPGFGWFAEVGQLDTDLWASRTMTTLDVTSGRIDWSHKVAERAASLQPSTTTLAIMNGLIRGPSDEWDKRRNVERAVELIRAADELSETPEYARLRTTLLERGAL
ncbi:hypothetical protein BDK89_1460 [Ilumatobacter fluminis]|uniref:Uncharacterized protein n=1 Tax=Ilumatobacter fluminis TaxID=467091 RepID=A0A4R7HXS7_9ACTN|nr:hypothetical protein [Ilumatobacter fluminis]TDT15881.1 hypothetical protein BDK89_1460 [Ilumatobacter fluminis]